MKNQSFDVDKIKLKQSFFEPEAAEAAPIPPLGVFDSTVRIHSQHLRR
jgi:hypothetical protein